MTSSVVGNDDNITMPAAQSGIGSSDIVGIIGKVLACVLGSDAVIDLTYQYAFSSDICQWIADNGTETVNIATTASRQFLRCNWIGPPEPMDNSFQQWRNRALNFLGNVEPAYHLCHGPEHLVIALVLLEEVNKHSTNHIFESQYELLKVYYMQQLLLTEPSVILNEKMSRIIDNLRSVEVSAGLPMNSRVEFLLLSVNIAAANWDYGKSEKILSEAKQLCKLSPVLTGVLGKRTRFQEIEYSQLVVGLSDSDTTSLESNSSLIPSELSTSDAPQDIELDDDTLFGRRVLSEELPARRLADLGAAILLLDGLFTQRRHARTLLQEEELLAYIDIVLQSHPCFAVKACALFHRSKTEVSKTRKAIRAMQQLETLIKAFKDPLPSPEQRENFSLAVNMPPFWEVEKALGFALLQNGCTKEAVNIFTGLELWEDVIECYQRIGQKVKAEDLILKELGKNPTPSMWCRLGDLRGDPQCYESAWELSNHRSARSRRDLGRLYISRQQFEDAARVLSQGLEVYAVDPKAWFSLGYAQLKMGDFKGADISFRRCVNLDPENSLAWNNLGSVALKTHDYQKAYRVFQDAIRSDFENWNVWDNYQHACQKVKDFEEEIRAYHHQLELKGQLNVNSLGILITAVIDGVPDINGIPASRLHQKVKELCGAVTTKLADNGKAWFLYGKLQASELSDQKERQERKELLLSVVQKLQRAFRHVTKEKDWEKEEPSLIFGLTIAKELAGMQLLLMDVETEEDDRRSVRSSCKVMLDSVIARVEKVYKDTISDELNLSTDSLPVFAEIQKLRAQL